MSNAEATPPPPDLPGPKPPAGPPPDGAGSRRGAVALLVALLLAGAFAFVLTRAGGDGDGDAVLLPGEPLVPAELPSAEGISASDPLAYDPDQRKNFEARGAAGYAHPLFAKSPDGVFASAERTEQFRELIEIAADDGDVDADTMEAMVFLESAGRPEIIAGDDPENAAGLAQILAGTGQGLLGMEIDLAESRKITRQIARAARRDEPERVGELVAARAEIDARFDPAGALGGMATYLRIAEDRFGREDLAIASYHMGIGNLENVIRAYVEPDDASGPIADVVDRHDITYAALFYDSSPLRNPRTYRILSGFGDDSSTYLWRVLASAEILRLRREDPEQLERLAELHGRKATAEEVFHPQDETTSFEDSGELRAAREDGTIIPLPTNAGQLGFRVSGQMGELAKKLDEPPELYRGLRPEALATLAYIGTIVQQIAGADAELTLTSTVRDQAYQDLLIGRNLEATREFSLHTTGYAFDIRRRYGSKAHGRAFQFMIDRLRALAVIDYAIEPGAIHVTVSDQAKALEPLLDGAGSAPDPAQ